MTISNIKRYQVGKSKHNTLLRCKVSKDDMFRPFFYKAIISSDMVTYPPYIVSYLIL